MHTKEQLSKELRKGPFSVKDAEKSGLTRVQITRLKSEGILVCLETGIYAMAEYKLRIDDAFRIATLRLGTPSAICLLSALFYHRYAEEPEKTWVLVPSSKRTTAKNYVLLRSRRPNWKIGVEHHEGFKVTNPERTIVDCLIHRNLFDSGIAMEAVRKIGKRKGALRKVIEMGTMMKVAHRIQPYLEVLL